MHDKKLKFIAVLLVLLLGGCSMAPEYQQPPMPVANEFDYRFKGQDGAAETSLSLDQFADLGFNEIFVDPILQQLIESALTNNRNLRKTALTVEDYRARYRIRRSALLPEVNVDGYGLKQRTLGTNGNTTGEIYSVEAGLTSYELDFYGRIRNLRDSALEQYLAMESTHKSAVISLVSEVVSSYLSLLTDRELLQITRDTKTIEEDSYDLVNQRVEAGIANELDLAQARTSLETAKANTALYKRQVARDLNYLIFLTGGGLPDSLGEGENLLQSIAPFVIESSSLPSDILLRRPDIMAAEHELRAANGDIGAARAAFFPTVTLTTSAGYISPELDDLFDGSSGAWLFAPAIKLPIFTGGRLKAELDSAEIKKEIAVARYEGAVQAAFREVSDALTGLATYEEQLVALKANLQANEEYYSRAKDRYHEGVDSFLTLLDAQRSLYGSRQKYLTLRLDQLNNQINLYKVLGGGAGKLAKIQAVSR
ncbi:efflux transporter outer membrane subunit [Desulforhopalus singaporensis]|uniref:Outer membrane protein, multidrug efflux system n=1 Tax=Desulforhopalus singaporensis TaxID=91360 RepID=A0A1H0T886_9BACT|nr:efflux transporter outer membrane subunit [Desulforhopalus singaporensis]SDP49798.1 outer membrane protein, multidrug efflux system [Desulforhopalus singaporensis]